MCARCRTPARGGRGQVAGRHVVVLRAARQVQDGPGAVHGRLEALAREQVGGDVAAPPGEDAHLVPGGAQQRYDEPAEGPRVGRTRATALMLAACGGTPESEPAAGGDKKITVCSGRSESLVKPLLVTARVPGHAVTVAAGSAVRVRVDGACRVWRDHKRAHLDR
ncbi:hypothetical protein ACQEUU_00265 [Nonomuraea sp. CA-218870]|uniref:hypothetical protein n=1 Tax=Nonomuraea sp. CA-218870 TaxID=3239998 RepID=UPI003D902EDC